MAPTSMPQGETVMLDRPFVYAIVDNSTNLPLFIGAVTNLD
jgi:serpin B